MEIIVRKPTLEEAGHMETCPIWECDVRRFDYEYSQEERCLIIEGKVEIEVEDKKFSFKEGDYVVFPKGLKCVWNVLEKVRKYYEFK